MKFVLALLSTYCVLSANARQLNERDDFETFLDEFMESERTDAKFESMVNDQELADELREFDEALLEAEVAHSSRNVGSSESFQQDK